jgi:hypothetical protein
MVATTVAAVRSNPAESYRRLVVRHVVGLASGAALLAAATCAIGAVVRLPHVFAYVVAAVAALWGAAQLVGRPLPVPSTRRQVPRQWRYVFPPRSYMLYYGIGLGVGVGTRVRTVSLYVWLLYLALVPEPWVAGVGAVAYAISRAIPVGASGLGPRWRAAALDLTDRHGAWMVRADALLLLVAAALLVSG